MKSIFIITLMLSVPMLSGSSSAPIRASVLPGSRVTIEGSSTVNRFECAADDVRGSGHFANGLAEGRLSVSVESLDCGKSRMNRDMWRAMKADAFPEIHFELVADELPAKGTGDVFPIQGRLSIAGVEQQIDVDVSVERLGNRSFRIRGSDEVFMSDFGIDPPTALAGLIRAHDRIVVRYDLVASANEPRLDRSAAVVHAH